MSQIYNKQRELNETVWMEDTTAIIKKRNTGKVLFKEEFLRGFFFVNSSHISSNYFIFFHSVGYQDITISKKKYQEMQISATIHIYTHNNKKNAKK